MWKRQRTEHWKNSNVGEREKEDEALKNKWLRVKEGRRLSREC